MNKKTILKCFSVLLALSMLIAMLPAGAYAADAWDGSIDVSWYNTTDTSFTITSPAQLAGLAAIVNGTAEGITQDSFAGKTITLGANIDLGNKNWTPIGCRTARTTYVSFAGCFDGYGYKIYNLTITYDIKGQKKPDGTDNKFVGCIGLFGSVAGNTQDQRATVKNLILDGSVTITSEGTVTPNTPNSFAGLAGKAGFADFIDCSVNVLMVNDSTTEISGVGGFVGNGVAVNFERCVNLGTINGGSYAIYIGGLVGNLSQSPFSLVDSYNVGDIAGFGRAQIGGLVGYAKFDSKNNGVFCNCYNIGSITGPTEGQYVNLVGAIIGNTNISNTSGVLFDIDNTYYLNTSCSASGIEGAISITETQVESPAFVTILNNNNAWKIGMTYPILKSQPDEVLLGDINRSGKVDENDVTVLIENILGISALDQSLASIGDLNENSLIDENDVTHLIQTVLNAN